MRRRGRFIRCLCPQRSVLFAGWGGVVILKLREKFGGGGERRDRRWRALRSPAHERRREAGKWPLVVGPGVQADGPREVRAPREGGLRGEPPSPRRIGTIRGNPRNW